VPYTEALGLKEAGVALDPRGRCNLVEPGWTVTGMVEQHLAQHGALHSATRTMPLRQLATPVDVARAIAFFASPAMSRHISGEAMLLAGGMEGRVLW